MRIKNLKIGTFGKLEDVSIGLDEKITVISGKNEAGKSSIAAFIKYMLYGFDSSKKADVSENHKKKYMPWFADECSGELEFVSADGKSYTAVRKTAVRSQNTVFDTDNMPLTSDNAGDYFLGVNENAYKKTAFIGQKQTSFTDDGELDSAIRNMVFSADESVDSRTALKKLEDIRKHYLGKAERSGEIFDIEKELSELCEERDKWQNGHKELLSAEYQLSELKKKISFNKEKKELLEREKQNLEYLDAKNKLCQLEEMRKKVEQGKAEFEANYKLMQNGSFVPDGDFAREVKSVLVNLDERKRLASESASALQRAKENLDAVYSDSAQKSLYETLSAENESPDGLLSEIESLKQEKKRARKLAIILTCLIITIPVAVYFFVKSSRLSLKMNELSEKYGCSDIDELEKMLLQGDSYKNIEDAARRNFEEARKNYDNNKEQLSELASLLENLSQKGGFETEKANEYLNELSLWLSKNEALKTRCREDYVAYNTLASNVDMQSLSELASKYDETLEVRDVKTVNQQLSFYTQANDALSVKERELEKQAAVLSGTLPKPSEIQSRILSLSAKRDEMRHKHAAITLAIDTLEKASESMRSEAAPRIAAETGSLFSLITGGKYKALYADSEMKLTFLEKDEAEVRDAGYLSAGTLDAAYISLRIALCEFLYKEHPTLVFDDAFANMDNERLKNTLDFLVKLSEDFQIVILSCHDREKEYLNGKAKIINFEV